MLMCIVSPDFTDFIVSPDFTDFRRQICGVSRRYARAKGGSEPVELTLRYTSGGTKRVLMCPILSTTRITVFSTSTTATAWRPWMQCSTAGMTAASRAGRSSNDAFANARHDPILTLTRLARPEAQIDRGSPHRFVHGVEAIEGTENRKCGADQPAIQHRLRPRFAAIQGA